MFVTADTVDPGMSASLRPWPFPRDWDIVDPSLFDQNGATMSSW